VAGAARIVPGVRLRDYLDEPVRSAQDRHRGRRAARPPGLRDVLHNVRAIALDVHEFDPARRQTGTIFDVLGRAGFTVGLSNLSPLPWRSVCRRRFQTRLQCGR